MDTIPLDYDTLRLIWWLLLGILLIGFAVMDGFDLGVGTLLPVVARTDAERRLVLNVVGPVWEGNQVWLITGGGAIFAAFPALYAVSFSGFYLAMFLILFALILRPVGFKFRSKVEDKRWRAVWDWGLFVGGFVPSLVFGVAMGNVLLGAPFHFDDTLRIYYTGGFFALLSPFAVLCGLVSVSMLIAHGAAMLVIKTDGPVNLRARRYGSIAAVATALLFVLAGIWVATGISGHA
ncbi:MAG: cytochrome d ubiquinol oxidase subunit II, partial [Pseudoxanthomonas sp.]